MIYVAIDTTGLPRKTSSFRPQIIAIGVALVSPEGKIGSEGRIVRQPEAHLRDPEALGATAVHGLSVETILARGLDVHDIAPKVRATLGGKTLRGFNVPFLRAFLDVDPWAIGCAWDRDLMEIAAPAVKAARVREAALLGPVRAPKGGPPKRCSMADAFAHAAARGHDLSVPPTIELRCEANAIRLAKLARALGLR